MTFRLKFHKKWIFVPFPIDEFSCLFRPRNTGSTFSSKTSEFRAHLKPKVNFAANAEKMTFNVRFGMAPKLVVLLERAQKLLRCWIAHRKSFFVLEMTHCLFVVVRIRKFVFNVQMHGQPFFIQWAREIHDHREMFIVAQKFIFFLTLTGKFVWHSWNRHESSSFGLKVTGRKIRVIKGGKDPSSMLQRALKSICV